MLPSICKSKLHIGKLKIDYMTYFDDMTEYDNLLARLKEKLLESTDDSELKKKLKEALCDQEIGQGFDRENSSPLRFIEKDTDACRHMVVRGYFFTSRLLCF